MKGNLFVSLLRSPENAHESDFMRFEVLTQYSFYALALTFPVGASVLRNQEANWKV